jgi:hypothetical protein
MTATPRTAAGRRAAVEGPGRAPTPGAARAANTLHLEAVCLADCGLLDTGHTGEPPRNRRYESRWAEIDAAADRHVKQAGHPARSSARPAEVAR